MLRGWKTKRAIRQEELAALKSDIDKALAQVAAGRLSEFIAGGSSSAKKLLAARKRPSGTPPLAQQYEIQCKGARYKVRGDFLKWIEPEGYHCCR